MLISGAKSILQSCFFFIQLVPLLLVTDHDSGGYNMDDSEIGVVLMSVAVIQLLWLVTVHLKKS